MAKSIFKNYVYNVAYQIVTLLLPLITTPYISRVLLPEGVGTAAFINSITSYFVIAGTLGISLYGNRQIAYFREDKLEMSKVFWSIFTLKLIFSSFSIISYVFFVHFFVAPSLQMLYWISGFQLFAMMTDITWFFQGLEDFQKTVTRNLIIRLISVVLIFSLVKDINDLWLYIFISSFTAFLGQAIMWIYIPKEVVKTKINRNDIFSHFLPTLKIFIPQIAVQIYTVMDKTMLGMITNASEVAYYENSQKIVKMTMGLATSLGIVMMPRISNYFAKKDFENIKRYTTKSFIYMSFLTFPLTFGLMGIAKEFVPWFFGESFLPVIPNIILISPIILAISWSYIMGVQMMLPMKKELGYTIALTSAAVVNFVLNLFLIKSFQSLGAAISSVIAEFLVTFVEFIMMRNFIQTKLLLKVFLKYLIGAVLMFFIVRLVGYFMGVSIITTVIQIVTGTIIYGIYSILTKSEVVFYFINRFFKKQN
jgi:O-antigen/teichoic acid export membrane protein